MSGDELNDGEWNDSEPSGGRPRFRIVRGECPVTLPVRWRLDEGTEDPRALLVLGLHGRGMDEDSLALLLQGLLALPCRLLLPRAPYPLELGGAAPGGAAGEAGGTVRIGASWYPYDGDPQRFETELRRTDAALLEVLRAVEDERGLHPRRRVVLGFSQGGYCGSYVALRHSDLFDGMIVAGARVKTEILAVEIAAAGARGFQALLCHGDRDAAVPPDAATRSRAGLEAGGVHVELRTFAAGHGLDKAQVQAMSTWLARFV